MTFPLSFAYQDPKAPMTSQPYTGPINWMLLFEISQDNLPKAACLAGMHGSLWGWPTRAEAGGGIGTNHILWSKCVIMVGGWVR